MLECELVPVTLNNLDVVSDLTRKFGFPRSVGWIKRALFNPHVAPCDENARRGYVLKSREDGYVGLLCYSPMKLYLNQQPIIGYSGLLLGVQKKYGEWLMDLFKAVQQDEKGHLAFGNTSCSAYATKICRMARGDSLGPDDCCYTHVSILGASAYALAFLRRSPVRRFIGGFWKLFSPVRLVDCLLRRMLFRSDFVFSEASDFCYEDFTSFWMEYLKSNRGLVSSREPEILKHQFSDSLRAGKLVMLTARKAGKLVGYIVLRKYSLYGCSDILKYKIVDAIAICDDKKCLRDLIRAAKIYAVGHSGERIEYIGGNPDLSNWVELELKRKLYLRYNTTTYFYSGNNESLVDIIKSRSGWFFGPFDGERCLGHGEYIDS